MAHIKRLERLVKVLERVQADPKKCARFHMGSWAQETRKRGTYICAVGWGAKDPVLKRQGLRLGRLYKNYGGSYRELCYKGARNMYAAVLFFGLGRVVAAKLFGRYSYRSRTRITPVISRLKRFIRDAKKAKVTP